MTNGEETLGRPRFGEFSCVYFFFAYTTLSIYPSVLTKLFTLLGNIGVPVAFVYQGSCSISSRVQNLGQRRENLGAKFLREILLHQSIVAGPHQFQQCLPVVVRFIQVV